MPNRVFVDTSFVIALINDKDQYFLMPLEFVGDKIRCGQKHQVSDF